MVRQPARLRAGTAHLGGRRTHAVTSLATFTCSGRRLNRYRRQHRRGQKSMEPNGRRRRPRTCSRSFDSSRGRRFTRKEGPVTRHEEPRLPLVQEPAASIRQDRYGTTLVPLVRSARSAPSPGGCPSCWAEGWNRTDERYVQLDILTNDTSLRRSIVKPTGAHYGRKTDS